MKGEQEKEKKKQPNNQNQTKPKPKTNKKNTIEAVFLKGPKRKVAGIKD